MNRGGRYVYDNGKLVEHIPPTRDPYAPHSSADGARHAALEAAPEDAAGGERETEAKAPAAPPAAAPEIAPERLQRIQEAMVELDETDEAVWTAGRKPRVEALEELLGDDVSSTERDAAWAALNQTTEEN